VAVAAVLNNQAERHLKVKLPGGILEIEWNREDDHVYMTGDAAIVFQGEIDL
jgi:diaminopimelate epimerase